MLRQRARRPVVLAAAVLAISGCGARSGPAVERVAVIPFEDLGPDGSRRWVGYALAHLAAEQFAGSPTQAVFPAAGYRQAVNLRATWVLTGHFSGAADLDLTLVLQTIPGNRTIGQRSVRAPAGESDTLLQAVAGTLGNPLRPPGTRNPEAVRHYGLGWAAARLEDREVEFRRAAEADPGFGMVRLELAQLAMTRGRAEEARAWLQTLGEPDPLLKPQAALLQASIDGDAARVAAAMEECAQRMPASAERAEQAAQAMLRFHRYREAADWFGRAAVADPQRPDYWNLQAYPLAYAGDFQGAVGSLRRYQEADPGNPNTLDSLGEIHFRFGRFEEAERYFLEVHGKSRDFQGGAALVKAARSRLFRGDTAGAAELFNQYEQARKDLNDSGIALYKAQWAYESGRRADAVAAARALASQETLAPQVRVQALLQVAAWELLAGRQREARKTVEEALRLSGGRLAGDEARLVAFLATLPNRPEEWDERSRKVFPQGREASRREAMAYAYLLHKKFPEAKSLLADLHDQAAPLARDRLDILLGWALLEMGERERAAELLEPNPLIQPRAEPLFHALALPHLFYLRDRIGGEKGIRPARRDATNPFSLQEPGARSQEPE